MGGHGSGGHNKIKQDISQLERIDSFNKYELMPKEIERISAKAGIQEAEYFKCPICGKRVRYLYEMVQPGAYFCRVCAKANYPCQQLPRYRWAVRKMIQILEELDVDTWNFENMSQILKFEPVWPKGKMSKDKYERYCDELLKWKWVFYECSVKAMKR